MAGKTGMSQTATVRIWNAFGLQPHRTKTFKLSKDSQFIDKVRDVVGLYLDPPERAIVLCVDEKSQVQALDRLQPLLPMTRSSPERHAPGVQLDCQFQHRTEPIRLGTRHECCINTVNGRWTTCDSRCHSACCRGHYSAAD